MRGELGERAAQTEAMRDEILRLERENTALKDDLAALRAQLRKENHETA